GSLARESPMRFWNWLKRRFGLRRAEESRSVADLGLLPSRQAIPAAQFLHQVVGLQQKNASWDEIWRTLNPDDDLEVQRLLVELRGPHLFAPHVALNVLEEGCRRVLAGSPDADRLAALQAALKT